MRVHGDVRRASHPIDGFALSFEPLEPAGPRRAGDWDFTDEDGRYEVELRAARYLVRDVDGAELADVVVPSGQAEFALDLELGPARP